MPARTSAVWSASSRRDGVLAGNAVSDIEEYWSSAYGDAFDGEFTPVEALISWDANGFDDTSFCDENTYGLVNAAFCFDDNTIGWDRGELLPALPWCGALTMTKGEEVRWRMISG